MTILINNCEESSYSLEALLRNCFYQDASGNIYLGVKLGSTPPDGSPSNLIALGVAIDQINLSWTNGSTDEDGLSVERSTDGISYAEIDTVAAGVSTYNDTGLSTNTLYYYRVRAFKGALYSDYSNVDSTPTWSTQYRDVNDEFASAPSNADADAQATFVKAGVDDGWLADLDRLFVFASHASGADSLLDWTNPSGTGATLVNAPTFAQYEGYTPNGTTQYINSNYNPNSGGVNYTQNDASTGVYIRTNVADNDDRDIGSFDATRAISLNPREAGDLSRHNINDAGGSPTSDANTDSRGMFSVERTASNARQAFKNGTGLSSDTQASGNVPNLTLFISALNFTGSPALYSTRQISLMWAGSSLGSTKQASLYNAFQALMTYYGKQV